MRSVGNVLFIDASEWTHANWYNSGGTRAKRILQDDNGKEWFFKCSERKSARDNKPEKYYKYEFWSEIIATQLGQKLGLDVLRYDVAINNSEIGCISPNMIDSEKEQLVEMGRYMTAHNNNFSPVDKKTRKEYTFQLLEETLKRFELEMFKSVFLQTMVFDALIGNTDRHQENWAFIAMTARGAFDHKQITGSLISRMQKSILKFKKAQNEQSTFTKEELEKWKLSLIPVNQVAPIYDNGSSMARELNDEQVAILLANASTLEYYVDNGKSELHWEQKKINHFGIMNNLLHSDCSNELRKQASFLSVFSSDLIVNIVGEIDQAVPDEWSAYKLPQNRKELITKLVTLRAQKLKNLLNV